MFLDTCAALRVKNPGMYKESPNIPASSFLQSKNISKAS